MNLTQQNYYYQHILQEMNYNGTSELQKLQLQKLKEIARYFQIQEGQKKMDLIQNILQIFIKWLITSYNQTIDNFQLMTFKTNMVLFQEFPLFKTIIDKYNEKQTKSHLLLQQQLQQQLMTVGPNLQGIYLLGGNPQNVLLPDFQNPGIPYLNDRIHQSYIPQTLSPEWLQFQMKARQSQQALQQAYIQNKGINNQSIVNQECICANCPALAAMLTPQDNQNTLTCKQCYKLYHCACLRVDPEKLTKTDRKMFECPKCILKSLDPLTEVQQVLVQPCITEEYFQQYFLIDKEMHKQIYQNQNIGIEIRCVRIEGVKNNHEITWPDYGSLIINGKRVIEFKPLQINSALKKRKDDKFFCRENCIRSQQNQVICKKEKATAEQKIGSRIDEKAIHMWGVFLVKKLTRQELIEKTLKNASKDIENCKKQIESVFTKQTDGLSIDKIQINLLDPFDFQLIKTPAKGKYCSHLNCFSLENLIMLNENTVPKRWKCPICKNKCYDFVIDTYQQQILKEVKEKPNSDDYQELIFSQNGGYEFKIFEDNESSQESQSSGKLKNEDNLNSNQENFNSHEKDDQQKDKQNNNNSNNNQAVIILDSDEEQNKDREEENKQNQNAQQQQLQLQQQLTDEQLQQIATENNNNGNTHNNAEQLLVSQQNQLIQNEAISDKSEQLQQISNANQASDENQAKFFIVQENHEELKEQSQQQEQEEINHPIKKQIKKNPEMDNLIQID